VSKKDDKNSQEADLSELQVKVYAPFKTYFQGVAQSLSAANHTGPFDVLPGHHKFLTILSPCDIIIRQENQDEVKIPIKEGVLFTQQNKVSVFLDV